MSDWIYLDHGTISPPSFEAVEKMLPFLRDSWGAVESAHRLGQDLISSVDEAVSAIYEAVGSHFDNSFTFFSSGPLAIEALFHELYFGYMRETGKTLSFTSVVEEAPIRSMLKKLEGADCSAKMLPVDSYGRLLPEALEEAIGPRTAILSISMANRLTGVLQPAKDLCTVCKRKGIFSHLDISTVLGKIPFSFEEMGADFITFEGSLLHAPRGSGGLFMRRGIDLERFPPIPSPWNMPLVAALATAMEGLQARLDYMCTGVAVLRNKFEERIKREIPHAQVLFSEAERLPHISSIAFSGCSSEALAFQLQKRGLFSTFGSKETHYLAPILKACGVEGSLCFSSLSFALSHETTEEQIDRAVQMIKEVVFQLRRISNMG